MSITEYCYLAQMSERSKESHSRCDVATREGSNPSLCIFYYNNHLSNYMIIQLTQSAPRSALHPPSSLVSSKGNPILCQRPKSRSSESTLSPRIFQLGSLSPYWFAQIQDFIFSWVRNVSKVNAQQPESNYTSTDMFSFPQLPSNSPKEM